MAHDFAPSQATRRTVEDTARTTPYGVRPINLPVASYGDHDEDSFSTLSEDHTSVGHSAVLPRHLQLEYPMTRSKLRQEEMALSDDRFTHNGRPIARQGAKYLDSAQRVNQSSPGSPSRLVDDGIAYHSTSIHSSSQVLDDPEFKEFLESIPESDPTTLQSLLPESDDTVARIPGHCGACHATETTNLGNTGSILAAGKGTDGDTNINQLTDIVQPYPEKYPGGSATRFDESFEHICFIKELVDSFGVDPNQRKHFDDQYCELPVGDNSSKGKQLGPPLSRLIHDIQELSSDLWDLTPRMHSRPSFSGERPRIRLSEIVIIMFLHHGYLREHTNLSAYEIHCLSLGFSDLFFKQIQRYFKNGKIHSIQMGSPKATELAIDLGTLLLLISYAPSYFRSLDMFDSASDPTSTTSSIAHETSDALLEEPERISGTGETVKYVLREMDRIINPNRAPSAQDREIPFRASGLPERWGFLKDYLSHWVSKVGLCSTEPSVVASSLMLAQKLCCMKLSPTEGRQEMCTQLQRTTPLVTQAPNIRQDISALCQQLQENWIPRRASEALLGNKRVLAWNLMALWWLDPELDYPENISEADDMIDVSWLFPLHIRARLSSVKLRESKLQELSALPIISPELMETIGEQWRDISHEMGMPEKKAWKLAKGKDYGRQISLHSWLKLVWM
ncbi:P-loop containing nucleoside triphosphate hydrolase protein [Apiospora arundinis]